MTIPRKRIPVAVLGATGSVGQRFVLLLQDHPWFELDTLTASSRSAGRAYGEACRWMQAAPLPARAARLPVRETEAEAVAHCPIVFSALDASVAEPAEREAAAAGCVVVSNAKSHRMHPEVPLLVPEVNAEHLELARRQSFGAGAILTNPNCSTIGLTLALKPLVDAFGVDAVHVVTLQAVSGAGIPGVSSLQIVDNVVPFIGGEEEKLEREVEKILGSLRSNRIEPHAITVSATCTRVPVVDGHTECVSVKLRRSARPQQLIDAWNEFPGVPRELDLPSAPARPVQFLVGEDRPQPRLDRDLAGGMAASVGRLRPCPVLDYKFVTLSHNTVRGAAGGALLVGELAVARGLTGADR